MVLFYASKGMASVRNRTDVQVTMPRGILSRIEARSLRREVNNSYRQNGRARVPE